MNWNPAPSVPWENGRSNWRPVRGACEIGPLSMSDGNSSEDGGPISPAIGEDTEESKQSVVNSDENKQYKSTGQWKGDDHENEADESARNRKAEGRS